MSKLMIFLTIACLLIFSSTGLFAYDSDMSHVTFATAQVTGTPVANLSVKIKNILPPYAETDKITWPPLDPASPGWILANQMIEIDYNANQPGWGILIMTDNTNTSIQPQPHQTLPGSYGLLGVAADGSWSGDTMMLVWSGLSTNNNGTTYAEVDSFVGCPTNMTPCCIPIVKDYSDFTPDALDYVTVVNSRGIQQAWMEGGKLKCWRNEYWNGTPDYIYLRARVKPDQALGPYVTKSLTIELYHQ